MPAGNAHCLRAGKSKTVKSKEKEVWFIPTRCFWYAVLDLVWCGADRGVVWTGLSYLMVLTCRFFSRRRSARSVIRRETRLPGTAQCDLFVNRRHSASAGSVLGKFA